VSTLGSFHGRTLQAWSVTGGPANLLRYTGIPAATDFVPYGDFEALRRVMGSETAAVILEPVQGEGGVRIPDQDYLRQVSGLCRERGILMIVDEIQTGFCRTGRLFAMEHSKSGVEPDFLTMGKGLAGGFPLAALAVTDRIAAQVEKGDHGGTYCGNPLGCAVALAVVEYLVNNKVAEQVRERGVELCRGLEWLCRRYPKLIKETRGVGLLTAIELTDDRYVTELTGACQERGLLVTPTRNAIVRLIPDLLVCSDHVEEALVILDAALSALTPRVAAAS